MTKPLVGRPVDDRYFEWLYSQVGAVRNRNPRRSYWNVCRLLFSREFVWFIPNDDNRYEDGRALRNEFLADEGFGEVDPDWMDLGCSMLEMLIALARRAEFQTDVEAIEWFHIFLQHMGLADITDDAFVNEEFVNQQIDIVIHRKYDPSGRGGLFPLLKPKTDQRNVELWYQMAAYIIENNMY